MLAGQQHTGPAISQILPARPAQWQLLLGLDSVSSLYKAASTGLSCLLRYRIGYSMITGAEQAGQIVPGKVRRVEPFSTVRPALLHRQHGFTRATHSQPRPVTHTPACSGIHRRSSCLVKLPAPWPHATDDPCGADEREHGDWAGVHGGCQGLQAGADHARDHVHRAAHPAQGIWR